MADQVPAIAARYRGQEAVHAADIGDPGLPVCDSTIEEVTLPAAASMWARRKRPVLDGDLGWASLARVVGGSDRLVAVLWQRYAPQVCHA